MISILDLNRFLDGVVQSDLANGNVIVKKTLSSESSNIRNRIIKMLSVSSSNELGKLIRSQEFMNNYANLLKSIGQLEIVPFSFFENQL